MIRLVIVLAALHSYVQAQSPLMDAFLPRFNTMKQNLLESAEVMPEEHYSFQLTSAQRSFGDWIGHTVMLLHNSCAAAKGESAPAMDHSKHAGGKSKADLQKSLAEAAGYCDSVFREMTDKQALSPVTVNGKPAVPVNAMLGLVINLASHYGNLVGYMRVKGITPPSTARAQKR